MKEIFGYIAFIFSVFWVVAVMGANSAEEAFMSSPVGHLRQSAVFVLIFVFCSLYIGTKGKEK